MGLLSWWGCLVLLQEVVLPPPVLYSCFGSPALLGTEPKAPPVLVGGFSARLLK